MNTPDAPDDFLNHIAASLGRTVRAAVPVPPVIDPGVARLITLDADRREIFLERANAAKLHATRLPADVALAGAIVALLTANDLKSAVVTRCERFERAGLVGALRNVGVAATCWDEATLDAAYDVDVGITDVWCAVAETGSLVVKSSPQHGRAVSLVPPYHVAVVSTSQIVPDLIDAMAKVRAEGSSTGVVFITGPSKTADIEMNLVTGVHGPGEVHVFVVD